MEPFDLNINTEVEYKYWAHLTREELEIKLKNSNCFKIPTLIKSVDRYYTLPNTDGFLRYRNATAISPTGGMEEISQMTIKREVRGNVIRKEAHLQLGDINIENIMDFISLSPYQYQFTIQKETWCYDVGDAEIIYYKLDDDRYILEIEAKDSEYSNFEEALRILKKWSHIIGVHPTQRETRSLCQIFSEERAS
jgi:adenylate cyclase class IV